MAARAFYCCLYAMPNVKRRKNVGGGGYFFFLLQTTTPPLCMINTIFFLTSLVVIWPLLNAGEKRVQWIEMALKHFKCVELAVSFKSLFLFYSNQAVVNKQPCLHILFEISSKLSNTSHEIIICFLWALRFCNFKKIFLLFDGKLFYGSIA